MSTTWLHTQQLEKRKEKTAAHPYEWKAPAKEYAYSVCSVQPEDANVSLLFFSFCDSAPFPDEKIQVKTEIDDLGLNGPRVMWCAVTSRYKTPKDPRGSLGSLGPLSCSCVVCSVQLTVWLVGLGVWIPTPQPGSHGLAHARTVEADAQTSSGATDVEPSERFMHRPKKGGEGGMTVCYARECSQAGEGNMTLVPGW